VSEFTGRFVADADGFISRDEFLGLLSTGMLEELRKAMIAGGVMREETVTKAAEHMSAHLRSGFSISS